MTLLYKREAAGTLLYKRVADVTLLYKRVAAVNESTLECTSKRWLAVPIPANQSTTATFVLLRLQSSVKNVHMRRNKCTQVHAAKL